MNLPICGIFLLLWVVSHYQKMSQSSVDQLIKMSWKGFYVGGFPLFPIPASGTPGWRRINKCLAAKGMKKSHFPFIPCFILGKMRACAGMQHGSSIPQQKLSVSCAQALQPHK